MADAGRLGGAEALSLLLTARLNWSALTPEELLSALGQVLAAATLA